MAVPSVIKSGLRAQRSHPQRPVRWLSLAAGLALALSPLAASAETVLEKALRTGELVMVSTTRTKTREQPGAASFENISRFGFSSTAAIAGR